MNRYPLWRYILLAVLIVLGLLYAAPVLYPEDYAIQLTPKGNVTLTAAVGQKVTDALKQHQIPYKSIKREPYSYLIRFYDVEAQLKAQDVIQAVLGDNYSVALNLAPTTPKWLQAIGAHPLKLGLDLRGGIHFLLQVNVDEMFKQRVSSDIRSMSTALRKAQVRYAGIAENKDHVITLRFRTNSEREKALQLLKSNQPDYLFTPLDQGGVYLLQAKMTQESIIKLEAYALTQNITILRNRVNELGVAEPVIQQQGKDQISVDLPGIQDTARAKAQIGAIATVRFQLVDDQNDAEQAARSGIVPFGDTLYKYEGRPLLLKNQIVLSGQSVLNASTITGDDGRPAVSIRAGGPNISNFNNITRENIGKSMATVYVQTIPVKSVVNGKVQTTYQKKETIINAAVIQSALGNNFQITGLQSMRYAQDLALQLRSGAYSAPVSFVQEQLVGPSLGQDNIRMGVLSVEIGSLVVFVFMAFYYRLFGLFADLALTLNVVFVIAVMAILNATLTLPGIAAIVLTVGMAVDANVLINERIREELRNGISPQTAIHEGYQRAFMTIVDANVTTLIVALVLFALGTGPVKGFAVTLSIGLITSMITAIFFTRALVNLVYGGRSVKHISIGIKVRESKPITQS